jgi:hypothetical protein
MRRRYTQWSEVINPDFASHVVQRIPNCRYTDGAWRPHFDEYDVIRIHSIQ